MKIVRLSYKSNSITGGHKYNDELFEYLSQYSGLRIVATEHCPSKYHSWNKFFAPVLELRNLKQIDNGDMVFFMDSVYKFHLLLLVYLKLFRSVKSIVIIHHFLYLEKKGIRRSINRFFELFYYKLCHILIIPNPYTIDVAKKEIPLKKTYYIPTHFKRTFSQSLYYEKGNLLYVGTIEYRKGLEYLIGALNIIRNEQPHLNLKLNIVGKVSNIDYYNKLQKQIKTFNLEEYVSFAGRITDSELDLYFKRAEIFVFPSLLEGYGLVILEAISRGVPVVAFNNSAMPYTLKDGENGLLAENLSSVSLASKIISLMGNLSLREHLMKGMEDTMLHIKDMDDFHDSIKTFCQIEIIAK